MMKAYLFYELNGNLANFPVTLYAIFLDYLISSTSFIGYKNFINAVSDASPIVGLSNHGILTT